MKHRKRRLSLAGVAICASLLLSSTLYGKDAEEIWRELAKLSGEKRQKALITESKAEAKVVFYANISTDHLEILRQDFEKRYPGIKLEIWRGSGERTSNRILTEARAGKFDADVIGPGNEYLPTLMKAGLVGRYNSPERVGYLEIHKDRDGYWTSYVYNLAVIAYNTKLVSAAEAPRTYEDFLNPKWKGDFAIDMEPDRAVMGWLKTWGEEKTERFFRGLMRNEPVVRKGHTLLTQLLCAGEFKVAVELYAYRLAEVKNEKGCPVEIVYPDPTPGAVTPLVVAKRAPHAHAAALLVDYLLSEPGQRILAERGWFSGRRGIKPKFSELDVEGKGIRVLLLRPDDADRLGKKYLQLREEFLLKR